MAWLKLRRAPQFGDVAFWTGVSLDEEINDDATDGHGLRLKLPDGKYARHVAPETRGSHPLRVLTPGGWEIACWLAERNFTNFILVIDDSASMLDNDPDDIRISESKKAVDEMQGGQRAGVILFSSTLGATQGITADKTLLNSALNDHHQSSGTNLTVGLTLAMDWLEADAVDMSTWVVIMLTDGVGTYSHTVTDRAIANGLRIFTIGLTIDSAADLLATIAAETGGSYFFSETAGQLTAAFAAIFG